MCKFNHKFGWKAVKAAAAAVLMTVLPGLAAAQQSVITNTATTQWIVGSTTRTLSSNTVSITVQGSNSAPALQLYTINGNGPGAIALPVPANSCANPPPGMAGLGEAWEGIPLSPAQLDPTTAIHAGQPLVISVTDPAENMDPAIRETLRITLTTPAGDAETLLLLETAANSGQFTGAIQTIAVPPAPIAQNCRLSVQPGDTINLATRNDENGQTIGTPSVNVLVDPFGMAFDSASGAAIPGVRITLIDAGTGNPAQVFGDDGVSVYPSTVITGQTVTDSNGNVYPYPAGDYRFPLVSPGDYRLLVEAPAPYIYPSTAPAAQVAALRRSDNGDPFTISSASYGAVFFHHDTGAGPGGHSARLSCHATFADQNSLCHHRHAGGQRVVSPQDQQ